MSGSCWLCGVGILLKILVFQVFLAQYASPTDLAGAQSYQSLSQNHGLFNSSDNVVILNATNFKNIVYGSGHAWIVEFYNSWCGFCQRFAPTWKALADNILGWRDIVGVAAIDCVDEDNNPLCRDYEIMRYPELRYFSAEEAPQSLGKDVEKGKDLEALLQNLILRMQKEQQEGRGSRWPNITPFRSSEIKSVFEGVEDSVKQFIFLFEEPSSSLGSEIILDFHKIPSLRIRRVTSDNNMLCLLYKVTRFPALIAFSREGTQNRLDSRVPTREMIRSAITEFLKSKGIDTEMPRVADSVEKPVESGIPAEKSPEVASPRKDVVNQADLESALRFSITHEIPMIKMIERDRMVALKNYMTALGSYFPMKRGNPMFLNTLSFVVRSKDSISGQDFADLVKSTESEMSPVFSEPNGWVGCRGSKPGFRGYPCGLWTIFHTLTVNFAAKSEEYPSMESTQVLKAIHGYVKHFFGCSDCAEHFVKMAERNKMADVRNADEAVLWLWEAHNEVNRRLKSDPTADPEHPKIQYPSPNQCPQCRDGYQRFIKEEVLKYLKKHYSYSGIHYESSTSAIYPPKHHKPRAAQERLHFNNINYSNRKFGWDFTIFDISICVVLYVTSAAILMLVCIKFAFKRSLKKKIFARINDGKV